MHIAIILSQTPSYSETFFNSKIKGLKEKGIDVVLFCQKKDSGFQLCPVIELPKVNANPIVQAWCFLKEFLLLLPYFSKVFRFVKLERGEGSSIIQIFKRVYLNAPLLKAKLAWLHFGFATQALGSETVAKAIGAKMAVSFRGFDIAVYPVKHPNCYIRLWKHVDKVHSISNYLLKEAYKLGLSDKTPYQIITPAVDLNLITASKFNSKTTSETLQIVTIARLHYIKGIDILIETAALLKQKDFNFRWTVIGSGSKKDTERYRYHLYEKGLEREVVLTGKLSHQETLSYLNKALIYVQPSLSEGFCNAVLEAQAMGLLCIATNTGGIPENILHEHTGWVVPKNSPELMTQKLIEVLNLSFDEMEIISNKAIERVRKEFNIEKQQQEFLDFYKSSLEGGRGVSLQSQ